MVLYWSMRFFYNVLFKNKPEQVFLLVTNIGIGTEPNYPKLAQTLISTGILPFLLLNIWK